MRLREDQCLGDQWAAIRHFLATRKDDSNGAPARVISGPGTGKTTTLSNLIATLVEDGVNPQRILALTFNKDAATELKARSTELMLESGIRLDSTEKDGETIYTGADVRTYHSLGFMIARTVLQLRNFESVLVDPTYMIKGILGGEGTMPPLPGQKIFRNGMGWNGAKTDEAKQLDPKEAVRDLDAWMENMVLPGGYHQWLVDRWGPEHDDIDKWQMLYAMFQQEKQVRGKVTFSDMLYVAWLTLTQQYDQLTFNVAPWLPSDGKRPRHVPAYKLQPDAQETIATSLTKWRAAYDYILVDESQDTNPLQGKVVTLLAAQHKNILVVGDPDQSIYAFRGARPDYIESLMDTEFVGHKVYHLDHTRRFVPEIVDVANKLIEVNPRPENYASLKTARHTEHGVVAAHAFAGEPDQAAWVANEILTLVAGGDPDAEPDTEKYNDLGIIYRTHRTGATIEPVLFAKGIPYRVMGGGSAFNRKEIRVAMALMTAAMNDITFDELKCCINIAAFDNPTPSKTHFLGEAAFAQIERVLGEAQFEGMPIYDVVEGIAFHFSRPGFTPRMRQNIGSWVIIIQRMLNELPDQPMAADYINIARELVVDAFVKREYGDKDEDGDSRYEVLIGLGQLAIEYPDPKQFVTMVRQLQDDAAKPKDEQKPAVTLGTAHRWKGLERDTIFTIGMDDEIWPHKRSGCTENTMPGDLTPGICEERRLAFVAVTRAKNVLHIGYYGKSIFVAEMGLKPERSAELTDTIDSTERMALDDFAAFAAAMPPIRVVDIEDDADAVAEEMDAFAAGLEDPYITGLRAWEAEINAGTANDLSSLQRSGLVVSARKPIKAPKPDKPIKLNKNGQPRKQRSSRKSASVVA